MNLSKKTLPALVLATLLPGSAAAADEFTMQSPSKEVALKVENQDGRLAYSLCVKGREVLAPSALLWSIDGNVLGDGVTSLAASKPKRHRTEYELLGNHAVARNRYTASRLTLGEGAGTEYAMEFRVYDTGLAFRYLYTAGDSVTVDDATEFRPSAQAVRCWMQDNVRYYEAAYRKHAARALPEGYVAGPPVTVEYGDGLYACITEGGLVNFGGMGLAAKEKTFFQSKLTGTTRLKGEIATPWRVVMTGDLNSLVNNDIVTDVSAPRAAIFKGNMDWIKPGCCVWSWLSGGGGKGVTLENMKRFADMAQKIGATYNLVDEGWSHWEDKATGRDCWDMVKELVDYSSKRGVKTLLWKACPVRKGVPDIKTPERRRAFFAKCKELGVAGVKVDFFDEESQFVTRYYEEALKDAAEYGLVVNFHGSNKPTGLSRTYPNELSREGIMGMEFGRSWSDQNTVFPFTRFLAGHGDYTPLEFNPGYMGTTTEAHQIATMALFLSPLRCFSAYPDAIAAHPAKELIMGMPTVWDETRVLEPSEIGECAAMAHRKGDVWYVAAVTVKAKQGVRVPLDFLGKGSYRVETVGDCSEASSPKAVLAEKRLTRNDALAFDMHADGGFVAKITPVK